MKIHRTCDGIQRRDMLKAGTLTLGGLTLGNYMRMTHAGQVQAGRADRAIFIELPGGPSHLDTFDLKPDAASEYRGTFNPIATNVPGIQISEHLPKLAAVADKFAILRGVSHTLAAHRLGREYVNTGSKPIPALEYPSFGSVLAKEQPSENAIPNLVAIPKAGQGPGFLGIRYAALETNATPDFGSPFSVRGISLGGGIGVDEVKRRQSLLRKLDRRFAELEKSDQLLEGLDKFGEQAYSMITSARAREAFDISREPQSFAKQFGEDSFGQSCMLALRLVESGVRLVSVQLGGWDTHADNFTKLKDNNLPKLDAGLSGLLTGLEQRGLLETTAIFVTGEFGRTPKINKMNSRDHWPQVSFALMAGGGMRTGQVIGATNRLGEHAVERPVTFQEVFATLYHNLGIDTRYVTVEDLHGRPQYLLDSGVSPITELV